MAGIVAEADGAANGVPTDGPTAPWVQWRLVIALTIVAMLALLDKYALSLLVQPLKLDLGLSDTQVGIAVGAAFAIANIAIGVPAGWLADRYDRRAIVATGVLLWSVMAVLCGLAGNFWSFFLARAGVGLGEGLIPPGSYSLIRDGVAPQRHGRAFGVFAMSNTLGPGTALLLGGSLVALIASLGWHSLPIFGAVRPWQLTLILLGLAGLPLAALAFAFPDPARHRTIEPPTGLGAAFAEIGRRKAIYLPLILFSCASAMIASSLGIWLPAFVGRSFGLTPPMIGARLGLLLVVVGPIGLFTVGTAIDRLKARGRNGVGQVTVVIAATLLCFGASVTHASSQAMLWTLEGGVLLSSTAYLAIVSIIVSSVAPRSMVGKVMALMLVLQGIFGSGLSPVLTGYVADHVFAGPQALGLALSTVGATLGSVGLAAALVLARNLRRDSETAGSAA